MERRDWRKMVVAKLGESGQKNAKERAFCGVMHENIKAHISQVQFEEIPLRCFTQLNSQSPLNAANWLVTLPKRL